MNGVEIFSKLRKKTMIQLKSAAQYNSMKNTQLAEALSEFIEAIKSEKLPDTPKSEEAFLSMIKVVVGRLKNFDAITAQKRSEKKEAQKPFKKIHHNGFNISKVNKRGSSSWKYEQPTRGSDS